MFRSLERVTAASRVFCLAAIFGLLLVSRNGHAALGLALLTVIAALAIYLSSTTALSQAVVATAEAGLVGLVIGLALPSGAILLPYLVVLSLIAGISQGVKGVSAITIAQIATVSAFSAVVVMPEERSSAYQTLAPWLVTSILAGLVGAWIHGSSRITPAVELSSYESARRLLAQLRSVSRQLPSGLDLVRLSNQALGLMSQHGGAIRAAVFLRTEGRLLAPVAYSDRQANATLSPTDDLVYECWTVGESVLSESAVGGRETVRAAFPLRVGSRMIGAVLAEMPAHWSQAEAKTLLGELDEQSLRLDAAMTFEEIRSTATAEERRRLAREIHDGIAQEVASLGYLVDDLQSTATSQHQRSELASLRRELGRVVTELRLSMFDLRSESLVDSGLGAALSDYVRQVSTRTGLTVHLKLDEAASRLRVEVESELLRMAGEAITNARKHSGAENLWIECTVHPPFAQIEIRDDGVGLRPGRDDSYGLYIMRERAESIDARLEVTPWTESTRGSGTRVRISVGDPTTPSTSTMKDEANNADASC